MSLPVFQSILSYRIKWQSREMWSFSRDSMARNALENSNLLRFEPSPNKVSISSTNCRRYWLQGIRNPIANFIKRKNSIQSINTWTVWDWMLRTRPVSDGRANERIGGAITEFFELLNLKNFQLQKEKTSNAMQPHTHSPVYLNAKKKTELLP